jgi:methyl-accepting chemotaxis protein
MKDGSKDGSKDDVRYGSPEAEMRSKLEIKEEKKKYDEHVARAKEVSQIASQISHSYETHKAFLTEDDKKLERLEKLTKRIRNDAGGAENRDDADKDIPAGMDQTMKKVSDMADELEKLVENTPRNVISAAVIDQANKLLGLIQHIRGTSR